MNEKRVIPDLTGNDFIDVYNLGFEAGRRDRQYEVDQAEKMRSDYYWAKVGIERKLQTAESKISVLKAKNKKLRKRLTALIERGA